MTTTNKNLRKVLSIVICLALVMSYVPMNAFASDDEAQQIAIGVVTAADWEDGEITPYVGNIYLSIKSAKYPDDERYNCTDVEVSVETGVPYIYDPVLFTEPGDQTIWLFTTEYSEYALPPLFMNETFSDMDILYAKTTLNSATVDELMLEHLFAKVTVNVTGFEGEFSGYTPPAFGYSDEGVSLTGLISSVAIDRTGVDAPISVADFATMDGETEMSYIGQNEDTGYYQFDALVFPYSQAVVGISIRLTIDEEVKTYTTTANFLDGIQAGEHYIINLKGGCDHLDSDGNSAWNNGTCDVCDEVHTDHIGGNPTCTTSDKCTICGGDYLNPDNHEYVNGVCPCGDIKPIQKNESGIYEIASKYHLLEFAQIVNGTHETISQDKSANAILVADIDMTDVAWTPIGSTALYYGNTYSDNDYSSVDAGYKGTFDGNGHIIKNLSITGSETKELSFGLFGTLSGTVKNLGVENLTYTGAGMDSRVGAVAGQILYGGKISNCYVNNANINTQVNTQNGVAGGIAGCNYAGTIENSFVYGLTIFAGRVGGIVGDNRADTAGDRLGTVNNCYTNFDGVCSGNKGYETNSKYAVSEIAFAKGSVTWYLNGQSAEGVWKQKGKLPGFTGTAVAQSLLSTYEQPEIKDGVYQIANKSQFFWFAEYVNFTDASVDAVLVNDIDLENDEWMPIGHSGNPYTGIFDGQGYTITNFKMTVTGTKCVALFGEITDTTVKNFNIYGEVTMDYGFEQPSCFGVIGGTNNSTISNIKSYVNLTVNDSYLKTNVAGIVGYIVTTTVEECAFYGTLDMGNAAINCGGGIVAYGNYNNSHLINNCAFYGTIHSDSEDSGQVGGIIGYYRGSNITIKNCLNVGTMDIANTTYVGAIGGRVLQLGSSRLANLANNYFCNTNGIPAFSATTGYTYSDVEPSDYSGYGEGNAKAVTATQLASGEIAYILQTANTEQVWGQDSNREGATPILDSTGLYKVVTVGETGNYSVANVGDTNADGTVDVTDYQTLVNKALADDHEQIETASYDDIVKYDLNGDGYLDVLDASLMHLFINGFTTVDVYAVGDYDLNGKAFEEADIKAIKHAIENPEKLATYKKYASDINGDGRLSEEDLTQLTAIYGEVTGAECADNVKVYYRWGNKYSTCTATAMCTLCGETYATETVKTKSETITESTCTKDGEVKYTATFTNELFEEQVKNVTIDMLGHDLSEYVNNNNGKHTVGCVNCDYTEKTEGHNYKNGKCACGDEIFIYDATTNTYSVDKPDYIQIAIDDAETMGTTENPAEIVLLADIEITDSANHYGIVIETGNIKLDLNGHTINHSGDTALRINSGAVVTVLDSGTNGGIKGTEVGISNSGVLTVMGGSISGNSFGIDSSGTLNISGGNISSNHITIYGDIVRVSGVPALECNSEYMEPCHICVSELIIECDMSDVVWNYYDTDYDYYSGSDIASLNYTLAEGGTASDSNFVSANEGYSLSSDRRYLEKIN